MWPTRVCRASRLGTLVSVPGTGSATYVLGPLLIAALLGVLLLVVRWAFGRGPAATGRPRPEYGLLQPVAAARTTDQLEPVRLALDNGFWCGMTLYPTTKCTPARAADIIEMVRRKLRRWELRPLLGEHRSPGLAE